MYKIIGIKLMRGGISSEFQAAFPHLPKHQKEKKGEKRYGLFEGKKVTSKKCRRCFGINFSNIHFCSKRE